MTRLPAPRTLSIVSAFALAIAFVVAACGQPAASPAAPTGAPESFGPRPSSPATLTIVQPQDGQTLAGPTVHVSIDLSNATITPATTTSIQPDQGHIHLYVNGTLASMNYSTEQDLPLTPGNYALKAEFVAADHAPFSPRVWSNQVVITVH
jgi:Domain of unknown function (DUF4399)